MFKFELQAVLGLRESIEENSKRLLGQALDEKQVIVDTIMLLKETNLSYQKALKSLLETSEVMNIQELQSIQQAILHNEEEIEVLTLKLKKAHNKVLEMQDQYQKDRINRKVLTSLKERKKEDYLREENRKESLLLDELVSYKYAIKKEIDR